jgi:GNAT superfamily N-acetyltransferase
MMRTMSDRSDAGDVSVRGARVEEIIGLRHRVLRSGLPRQTASFDGDDEPLTRHLAAVSSGGEVVGCATIVLRPWNNEPAWQVRGMAVEDSFRGRGVGRSLLEALEREARRCEPSIALLWCNAHTPAVGFYRALGWTIASDEFVIETAGPHFRMTRRLD